MHIFNIRREKIIKINVTRSSMPSFEEYCEEINSIFDSKWLTNMGPKHNEFKDKAKGYLKATNLELFVNGHMALYTGIKAMELTGEVITTPFTFLSTTNAIVQNGLTPVFCDIEPDTYTIDPDKIEPLITEKTSAIIPVHVYGNVCDTDKIQKIADKYGLKVIYDAAHVFGVEKDGEGIGTFGDMSMFSFHATKVFNSIEGGCLTYKDKELTEKLCALRNFGMYAEDNVPEDGMNCKMNEFQAAMGICNLRHVDEDIKKRGQAEAVYRKMLSEVSGIKLCPVQNNVKSNYAYFPVVFDKKVFGKSRDEVAETLQKEDIFARKYFYPAVNELECYKGKYRGETPIAKEISENVLTLPMFSELTEADVKRICKVILGD